MAQFPLRKRIIFRPRSRHPQKGERNTTNDGWMDRQTDRYTDRQTDRICIFISKEIETVSHTVFPFARKFSLLNVAATLLHIPTCTSLTILCAHRCSLDRLCDVELNSRLHDGCSDARRPDVLFLGRSVGRSAGLWFCDG